MCQQWQFLVKSTAKTTNFSTKFELKVFKEPNYRLTFIKTLTVNFAFSSNILQILLIFTQVKCTPKVRHKTIRVLCIENQIRLNPQITTDELAKMSNKGIATIKRHLAKMPHIRYVGSGYSGHWEVLDKE